MAVIQLGAIWWLGAENEPNLLTADLKNVFRIIESYGTFSLSRGTFSVTLNKDYNYEYILLGKNATEQAINMTALVYNLYLEK